MGNYSALLKEPLCVFGSLETVLPGSWQSIKGAKITLFLSPCIVWLLMLRYLEV